MREHLGIESFGVNVKEAAAGQVLVVPHRETDYGSQEELYFVFDGRARFTLDGADVELRAGDLLRVASGVDRQRGRARDADEGADGRRRAGRRVRARMR